jgi:hypothetical protein
VRLFGQNLVPGEGVTCGTFIRRLSMRRHGSGEILELVRKHYLDNSTIVRRAPPTLLP